MILFDVTKTRRSGHHSGLTRVGRRLGEELGEAARPVEWPGWGRGAGNGDWLFTSELFSEAERPGLAEFLRRRPCRCGALFHDAIPLRHPDITWPRSVARHAEYMGLLARFDRVWAVSEESRRDLVGFWRWQGVVDPPPVDTLALGADLPGIARRGPGALPALRSRAPGGEGGPVLRSRAGGGEGGRPSLLCVGILEPRKNQAFLAEVCEGLWMEGLEFDLHLVGRVNSHFGKPVLERLRASRQWCGLLHYHGPAGDAKLAELYAGARASAFPTIAEGSGLPLLESLWMGVPCVCSDLPVLRESAAGGGCLTALPGDQAAWASALRRVLFDDAERNRLAAEAAVRPLPTWKAAADALRAAL